MSTLREREMRGSESEWSDKIRRKLVERVRERK